MNELVQQVEISLNKKLPAVRLPYWLGYMVGLSFDLLAKLTGKKFSVSAVRVKKFCATTQFDATAAHSSGFIAPFTLAEGYRLLSLSKYTAPCITSLLIKKRMRLFLNRNNDGTQPAPNIGGLKRNTPARSRRG